MILYVTVNCVRNDDDLETDVFVLRDTELQALLTQHVDMEMAIESPKKLQISFPVKHKVTLKRVSVLVNNIRSAGYEVSTHTN